MSGRPKRAPVTPEEERELMRQLARELHEAAQDARDAARALAAERKEVADCVLNNFQPIIDSYQKQLQGHLDGQIEYLNGAVRKIHDSIHQSFAAYMGASTPAEIMDLVVAQLQGVVLGELKKAIALEFNARNMPEIHVATLGGLEGFVAAGGDPGIVLDGRG